MVEAYHRVYLFAAPAARPWVVGLFKAFAGDTEAQELNCAVELEVADKPGTTVAYACSFSCGQETMDALEAMIAADQIPPGITYAVCEGGEPGGVIRLTNFEGADIKGLRFYVEEALTLTGLQFKQQEPADAEAK